MVLALTFTDSTPQGAPIASFETTESANGIEMTHNGGNTIRVENLYITYGTTRTDLNDLSALSELTAGDTIGPIDPDGATAIELVWQKNDESQIIYRAGDYDALDNDTAAGSSPSLSSFSATNPSGQTVEVSFESSASLSTITVNISGASTGSLTRPDFTESGGTYTAKYAGGTDGDYTATLETAETAGGIDAASNESETVTVSTPVLSKGRTIVYQGVDAVAGDGGETSSLAVSGVQALGPATTDLTGDGSVDLPYIDGGTLKVIDSAGTRETLVNDGAPSNPETQKTLLGVGVWQGGSPSVFYVNQNQDAIYSVDGSGSTTVVATPSSGATAVMGIEDIDGDGTDELLFVDGSQQVRYIQPGGRIEKLSGGAIASNNGIGAGEPADFDGDGTARAVLVKASTQHISIVSDTGPAVTLTGTSVKKAPLTTADVDGDGDQEIVYVSSNGDVKYVDDPLGAATTSSLTDAAGNIIFGDGKLGVVS